MYLPVGADEPAKPLVPAGPATLTTPAKPGLKIGVLGAISIAAWYWFFHVKRR